MPRCCSTTEDENVRFPSRRVRAVRPSGGSQLEDNETHPGAPRPPLVRATPPKGGFLESSSCLAAAPHSMKRTSHLGKGELQGVLNARTNPPRPTAPPLTGGDFQESSHTAKNAVYVDQKNVGYVVLSGVPPHSEEQPARAGMRSKSEYTLRVLLVTVIILRPRPAATIRPFLHSLPDGFWLTRQ